MIRSSRRSRGVAADRRDSLPDPRAAVAAVIGATLLLAALFSSGPALGQTGAPAPLKASASMEEPTLFGVVGFYNPRLLYLKYQPLVDYLQETTGRRWELEIYTTYEDTVEDLCSGRLAAAYLGPLTYVRAHAQCGALPVVRLNTDNSATIQSLIMVRKNSPIESIEDLRGKRFGFGSPLSTTSHLVPRAMLVDAGLSSPRGFDCLYYKHHEKAARAVLLGQVEACGVRDTVGERFAGRGLRVLARSEPIVNFPIVVPEPLMDSIGVEILSALVLRPREDPQYAERMKSWDKEIASGFREVRDEDYAAVRELALRIFGDRALTMSADETRCRP